MFDYNKKEKDMSRFILLVAVVMLMSIIVYAQQCPATCSAANSPAKAEKSEGILGFTVKDIDGNDVELTKYKGKVLLIVNVASKCGLTRQYEKLTALYEQYKDKGFEILAFPANNFNSQEPGTSEEIKTFCTTNFDVTFPLFEKISVAGDDIAPLYAFLISEEDNPGFAGPIAWNFAKFLVDRDGNVVARFSPRTEPDADELVKALENALEQ